MRVSQLYKKKTGTAQEKPLVGGSLIWKQAVMLSAWSCVQSHRTRRSSEMQASSDCSNVSWLSIPQTYLTMSMEKQHWVAERLAFLPPLSSMCASHSDPSTAVISHCAPHSVFTSSKVPFACKTSGSVGLRACPLDTSTAHGYSPTAHEDLHFTFTDDMNPGP